MVKSMTGFGRCEVSMEGCKVTVEMKSVNHRYLELNIKMPKKFNFLESVVRNEMKKYVERGKIDIYVTSDNDNKSNVNLKYNEEMAEKYYQIYKSISEDLGIELSVDAAKIGDKPEVIVMEEQNENEELLQQLLVSAIKGASEKLVETRSVEGEHLKQDLFIKLDSIMGNVKFIEDRAPIIVNEYREKITQKVNELLDNVQIDEGRILQEVTLFADKVCVDEELVRLEGHVKAMRDAIENGGTVGRRLDFIAQEMNREANTTLSKTTDLEISNRAIELKTDIEKVREQIQNIE